MDDKIVRALTQLENRTVQVIAKSHDQEGSELNDHLCMVVGALQYVETANRWCIDEDGKFISFNSADVTKIHVMPEGTPVIFIYWTPPMFGNHLFRMKGEVISGSTD